MAENTQENTQTTVNLVTSPAATAPASIPAQPNKQIKYKRKLRNFLIHKPLQKEYTTLMIANMMVATMLVGFVIHETMRQAMMGDPYHIGKVSVAEVITQVNHLLLIRVSLVLFACVISATILGVVFLHRVAGPVYRFQILLRKMNRHEIPNDVKLRDNDYFKEVAFEFNVLFKSLRNNKIQLEKTTSDLEKICEEPLPPHIQTALTEISQTLKKI